MEQKLFFLPFYRYERLNKDTYTFYFRRTGEEPGFVAGQYFELTLPHKKMDERGDTRVFTISSSPTDLQFITITTRIIQSSFKLKLKSLNEGELVQLEGPWDDLNFDEKNTSQHVFIAGGIGITPYHSIIKYCINKNITTSILLLVSWKNLDELIFDDFFRGANNLLENFSYVPTITEDESIAMELWDGEKGRINEQMIGKYIEKVENAKFFISGPQSMVSDLKKTLFSMRVQNEKIITEDFEGY